MCRLRYFLLLIPLLCSACVNQKPNETAYEYRIADSFAIDKPQKLMIAHVNLGPPSKNYLLKYQPKIDGEVKRILQGGGYQIADATPFKSLWRQAIRKYGEPYNTYTSQQNAIALRRVMRYTLDGLKETAADVDAVVFTDLVEQSITFTGNNNRLAKWHGVSRQPRIKGSNSITAAFDWAQTVPAVSLKVVIFDVDGKVLFNSFGGLEVARELDAQRERFVRRDKMFIRATNVEQGVKIALHPFVEFSD